MDYGETRCPASSTRSGPQRRGRSSSCRTPSGHGPPRRHHLARGSRSRGPDGQPDRGSSRGCSRPQLSGNGKSGMDVRYTWYAHRKWTSSPSLLSTCLIRRTGRRTPVHGSPNELYSLPRCAREVNGTVQCGSRRLSSSLGRHSRLGLHSVRRAHVRGPGSRRHRGGPASARSRERQAHRPVAG